jgi:hypothetical protein
MKRESEYRDRKWDDDDDDDVRSGTGPICWYREGTTASVVDIISSTEANEPLVRARPELTRLVLSSSSTAGLLGRAAFRNDSRAC